MYFHFPTLGKYMLSGFGTDSSSCHEVPLIFFACVCERPPYNNHDTSVVYSGSLDCYVPNPRSGLACACEHFDV
jgi:hypothetical protein